MKCLQLGGFWLVLDSPILTPKMALYPYAYPYRDDTR